MMNNLLGLGLGIIGLGVIAVVGVVVVYNIGGSQAECGSVGLGGTPFYNSTANLCDNTTDTATPAGTAYNTGIYVSGQFGQSGLSGWIPTIIAISVGLLVLGAFISGKGLKQGGRY